MDGGRAVEALDLPGAEAIGRVLLHPGVHPHPTEAGSANAAAFPEWTLALAGILLVASLGGLLYWYHDRRGDEP